MCQFDFRSSAGLSLTLILEGGHFLALVFHHGLISTFIMRREDITALATLLT